ncbi:MAG: DNA-binding Lrp family transcriptional regulator [Myxococcota bacterium]|jgi:DNA-binding Lrp family transcriptional regulator
MKHELDRTDFEILALLQKNGRATNKEVSNHVGLAPSTVHARLARIEKDGIVRSVNAHLDPETIGVALQALVFVRLEANISHDIDDLWARLLAIDEIVGAFNVGGQEDLILHVAVRDTTHLSESVLARISHIKQINRVRTELVFRHERRPFPLLLDPVD